MRGRGNGGREHMEGVMARGGAAAAEGEGRGEGIGGGDSEGEAAGFTR